MSPRQLVDMFSLADPVVDEGVKYRVRQVTPHALHLSVAGPNWRKTPVVRLADPSRLEWDKVAAVWRGPTVPAVSGEDGKVATE